MSAVVRKAVVAVVAAMIAVVLTMDPFCCADGCTNGRQSAVAAPTCCSLCMSSVTLPTVPALVEAGVIQHAVGAVVERHVFAPAKRIEHPPRLL